MSVKKFLIGFSAGLIVVPVTIYVYFAYGIAPVATSTPEMPFERLLAKTALRVRREREMPRSVPIATDESNYTAGAHIYRELVQFATAFLNNPKLQSRKACIQNRPHCSKASESPMILPEKLTGRWLAASA